MSVYIENKILKLLKFPIEINKNVPLKLQNFNSKFLVIFYLSLTILQINLLSKL